MIRILLSLMLLPSLTWAMGVRVDPAEIPSGGTAVLRWDGPVPAVAIARFSDALIYLTPTEHGAAALLGVDLDEKDGIYPVRVMVADRHGNATFYDTTLRVGHLTRPSEHLRLPQEMVSPQSPRILERIAKEQKLMENIFSKTQPASWQGNFMRPVSSPLSSSFGIRRILNGQPRAPHSGVDFRSPRGTPVKAPTRGTVAFIGELYFTGVTLILDHGEGLYSLFAHLESVECTPGQSVEKGDVLGQVGSSGRSTGPHLHWSVKWRGKRVDPMQLLDLPDLKKP